jgi:hypothetical protein
VQISGAGSALCGSGTFTGTEEGSSGIYDLSAATGNAFNFNDPSYPAGESIIGLSNYAGSDNKLYYPGTPFVDFGGVSFSTSFEDYNIYWNGYNGILESTLNPVGYPNAVTIDFTVSQVGSAIGATPLPSTWTMLVAGFVGLGFLAARSGSRKNAVSIAAA